jgi:hypothetical protein
MIRQTLSTYALVSAAGFPEETRPSHAALQEARPANARSSSLVGG